MLLELIYEEVFGEEESILYLSRILEFVSLSQGVVYVHGVLHYLFL